MYHPAIAIGVDWRYHSDEEGKMNGRIGHKNDPYPQHADGNLVPWRADTANATLFTTILIAASASRFIGGRTGWLLWRTSGRL